MPEPINIDEWTEMALTGSPSVTAARYEAEVARLEIERIGGSNLPEVDAFGSIALNDSESRMGSTRNGKVGLRVRIPLYSGGSTLSRSREGRHRYRQTLEVLKRERRRVERETREAFLGVRSGISRVRALEQAVRSSRIAVGEVEVGFQLGTRSSLDVLDAQRNLFRSIRNLAEARYRYVLNVLRLKRAAGILSEDHLRLFSGDVSDTAVESTT